MPPKTRGKQSNESFKAIHSEVIKASYRIIQSATAKEQEGTQTIATAHYGLLESEKQLVSFFCFS